jgi:hypothetical protein
VATYLYGLVLDRNAHLIPAHITGIGGAVVRVVACGRLGAIASSLEHAPSRPSLDDVRAHDHALQAVVHHGSTAAAVRFGQSFAGDDDMRSHLSERAERAGRLLEDFDGCVEMRVLLRLDLERPAAPTVDDEIGPGRAYLERLRSERSRKHVEGLGLRDAVGPVIRAERVEELPMGRGVVFSHLIARNQEPEYRDALDGLPSLIGARVLGPLALYSFAEPTE